MKRKDFIKAEEERDKLIAKVFDVVKSRMPSYNGLGCGEAWIDEKGINLQVGYSVMGCADSDSHFVSWEELGL